MNRFDLNVYFDALAEAGVPKGFRTWTLGEHSDPTDPRVSVTKDHHNLKLITDLADVSGANWFLLSGEVGRGKTTMATAAFNDWASRRAHRYDRIGAQRPRLPLWITESNMFAGADMAGAKSHSGRAVFMERFVLAPLLVLDDLAGSRREPTTWQGGAIRNLIAERHANERATIFTTNIKSWEALEKLYGDHIVSRMIERCSSMTTVEGPDRRLANVS